MALNANTTVVVPVQLRLCREDDLPKLEWFGAYTDHRSIIRSAFDAQRAGAGAMVVAAVREFPVGQVWVDFCRFAPSTVALLWALRVLEPFQGLGLARSLVSAAEQVAWQNGCTVAEIEADATHDETKALYEYLGFVRSGSRDEVWSYTTPAGVNVEIRQSLIVFDKPLPAGQRSVAVNKSRPGHSRCDDGRA